MSIIYKVDILEQLKLHGFTTYRVRKERLLSESTLQKLRKGEGISWDSISAICSLLNCQPGDLMEYIPDTPSGCTLHFPETAGTRRKG